MQLRGESMSPPGQPVISNKPIKCAVRIKRKVAMNPMTNRISNLRNASILRRNSQSTHAAVRMSNAAARATATPAPGQAEAIPVAGIQKLIPIASPPIPAAFHENRVDFVRLILASANVADEP